MSIKTAQLLTKTSVVFVTRALADDHHSSDRPKDEVDFLSFSPAVVTLLDMPGR